MNTCALPQLTVVDNEEVFNINPSGHIIDADSPTSTLPMPAHKKLQAKLTCSQTHNKQLAITLCGMILGQDMMFGAEGVASVTVSAISCDVIPQS